MTDELKKQAALAALEEIRDGMIVGLGSGSTASLFIRELGRAGLRVLGIPTSEESDHRRHGRRCG
jgi:ribose 5-phosphate isomerase A